MQQGEWQVRPQTSHIFATITIHNVTTARHGAQVPQLGTWQQRLSQGFARQSAQLQQVEQRIEYASQYCTKREEGDITDSVRSTTANRCACADVGYPPLS